MLARKLKRMRAATAVSLLGIAAACAFAGGTRVIVARFKRVEAMASELAGELDDGCGGPEGKTG